MNTPCVSIITPFYKGNQHMKAIFACAAANARSFQSVGKLELVLVCDSPDTPIVYDPDWVQVFSFTLINNPVNVGIHQARVNGLLQAQGEYVIFLDQDDLLTDDAVLQRYKARADYDMIVSNGIEQAPPRQGLIYGSRGQQDSALKEKYYYYLGCRITSPGHCLIKKDSIPQQWKEYIVTRNGADDLLLWLLMFKTGKRFGADYHSTYTHVHTGLNLSGDFEKMYDSAIEVLEIMKATVGVTPAQEQLYLRRLHMRRNYEGKGAAKKLLAYLLNPDIALAMLSIKF